MARLGQSFYEQVIIMMKLIRRLFYIVVALLLLVAIGVGVLLYYLDNIAKAGIEKGGSYALGVPTRLENIDISIFSGKCNLDNLRIANPAGFEFDHFMKINHGEFVINTQSLRSDTIEIEKLHLTGIELSIEKNKDSANYQVILDNLKKTSDAMQSGETDTTQPVDSETKTTGKGFVIRDILIEDIVVNVNVKAITQVKKTIRLKEPIHLTHVGSSEDASEQLSTVIAKLVKTMLSEIIRQGGGLIPAEITSELGKGLEGIKAIGNFGTQIIDDTLGSGVKKMGEVTKSVTGDVVKGVGQVAGDAVKGVGKVAGGTTQEIGKAADGLIKGVGGLFGGKKKSADKEPAQSQSEEDQ